MNGLFGMMNPRQQIGGPTMAAPQNQMTGNTPVGAQRMFNFGPTIAASQPNSFGPQNRQTFGPSPQHPQQPSQGLHYSGDLGKSFGFPQRATQGLMGGFRGGSPSPQGMVGGFRGPQQMGGSRGLFDSYMSQAFNQQYAPPVMPGGVQQFGGFRGFGSPQMPPIQPRPQPAPMQSGYPPGGNNFWDFQGGAPGM